MLRIDNRRLKQELEAVVGGAAANSAELEAEERSKKRGRTEAKKVAGT